MKTKKIRLIFSIILAFTLLVGTLIIVASTNTISYSMNISKPDRIVVYYNSSSTNKVFEPGDEQYNQIYSWITDSFEQKIISAFIKGELFKKIKVTKTSSSVDFEGIKVNFVYDSPNAVKIKENIYLNNGEECWYQSLIFNIHSQHKYQYNNIAIIEPGNTFDYKVSYKAYSNFSKCYNNLLRLF